MSRFFLRLFNGLFSLVMAVILLIAGAYAAYALWDNERIYSAAENVQAELLSFKPLLEAAQEEEAGWQGPSFDELLAINPDVVAWVAMDGTAIDYPILQGETTLEYINKDVFGNFALAGSIFADAQCAADFSEPYWLIYGHDMVNSLMFGDLSLYKDEAFFAQNRTGTLILPGRGFALRTVACLLIGASDELVFEPDKGAGELSALLNYARENAVQKDEDAINALIGRCRGEDVPRIVALTTCSSEFTNARTVILCEVTEFVPAAKEVLEG